MLQDLDTTIKKLGEISMDRSIEADVIKLHDIIIKYSSEVARDLKDAEWRSQFEGGLNVGYILCLIGETEKGVDFLEKCLQVYQANMGEYDEPSSSILQFIVETIEEFEVDSEIVKRYQQKLRQAQDSEAEKPEDIRRKIVHIEADLECAIGDIDQAYSQGRREQGLLYNKLEEYDKATEHFRMAIAEDRRDWRNETTIKNKLAIVDSYFALGDTASAIEEFIGLMKILVPDEIEVGEKMPELFTENLDKFFPYFEKLRLNDQLEKIITYARARLDKVQLSGDKRAWVEIPDLTEIMTSYHVGREEYQEASDIMDKGREKIEYKHHISWREQAEYAIRAENREKALELIKADEAYKDSSRFNDNKEFELVNLYLQLGEVESALAILDGYCEQYKASLLSGSYGNVFETRRTQIAILKAVIGKDYFHRIRKYAHTKSDIFAENGVKSLPKQKDQTTKS